ncbi:hypothetical protein [Streptomyces viridochromogenes]|uniref:hypothetical protein n=1 Tax=Streptomyces viridochromogenes TaxID=1938 RepID=UPI001319C48D|nr:hypothetical protein [Streptomyces viridochromogenes]
MDDQVETRGVLDSPLVDLSNFPFDAIQSLPESVIVSALRRVRQEAARPEAMFTTNHDKGPSGGDVQEE